MDLLKKNYKFQCQCCNRNIMKLTWNLYLVLVKEMEDEQNKKVNIGIEKLRIWKLIKTY